MIKSGLRPTAQLRIATVLLRKTDRRDAPFAIETSKGVQRKKLKPEQAPKAEFMLTDGESVEAVYAYCNLHGLWKA